MPHRKAQLPPGQHGKDRKAKIVGYGLQLREKQKAKRIYLSGKTSSATTYEKAAVASGVTGEMLFQQLERRLDNVVYRLGSAISRRQSRQFVRHGHIQVNGRKVNIPSYQVKAGDEIAVREGRRKLDAILKAPWSTPAISRCRLAGSRSRGASGRVVSLPKREEINLPVNEQLIVELYSK